MLKSFLTVSVMLFGVLPVAAQDSYQRYTFKEPRSIFYCESSVPLTQMMSKSPEEVNIFIAGLIKTKNDPNRPCNYLLNEMGTDIKLVTEVYFDPEVIHNNAAVDGLGSLVQYGKLLESGSDDIRYMVMMQYFKADSAGVFQPQGWFEPFGNQFVNFAMKVKSGTP